MIVTKTPLRVSFFGGGSDLPDYYMHGDRYGLCVSTTINKYIYLAINRCVAKHIRLSYSQYELKDEVRYINHDIIRETLKLYNIENSIEISSFSDIPHAGSGLGSSSSFTVGLVNGLSLLADEKYHSHDLAEIASRIEIELVRQPIGLQDQFAAAYGGFNKYTFQKAGVQTEPVNTYPIITNMLEERLVFFNTGMIRSASSILKHQVSGLKTEHFTCSKTDELVKMAERSVKMIEQGQLDDFGSLLNDAWRVKKSIASGVSDPRIDGMYNAALKAGALGGKILGAGGGGYLMMYAPLDKIEAVRNALLPYYEMKVKFTNEGSKAQIV